MNVVSPKLRPLDYGAANDLKTEVEKARRAMNLYPAQAAVLEAYFAEVVSSLTPTSAVVSHNDEFDDGAGGTITVSVVAGVITMTHTP